MRILAAKENQATNNNGHRAGGATQYRCLYAGRSPAEAIGKGREEIAQPPPHCGRFQHWGVQGRMFTARELLAQCVAQRSSGPYCREHWNDLRSRAFRPELEAVCAQLGLTVEDLPARLWD